jgi:circadian clock protein KaiB
MGSIEDTYTVTWEFQLFIIGQRSVHLTALTNLTALLDERLPDRYRIEVIDLWENPQLAEKYQIIATPTLVRRYPQPVKVLIGDFSQTDAVVKGLEL